MDYRELPVPPALRRHVACLWRLADATPSSQVQTIYPDGCCELIVHLGQPMRACDPQRGWQVQAPTLFAGQQRGAIRLAAQASVHCVGLRLRPAASAVIAAAALPALRDRIVDLAGLAPAFSAVFAAACARHEVDGDEDALWHVLEPHLARHPIDPRIEQAIETLDADGSGRIASVAAQARMAPRTFQVRFLEQVGLGAKEFARIRRLQAMLRRLDAESVPLAQAAADGGFADQAHATREFGRITGRTPARLLAALRDDRDDDATIRLALAFVRGAGSDRRSAESP